MKDTQLNKYTLGCYHNGEGYVFNNETEEYLTLEEFAQSYANQKVKDFLKKQLEELTPEGAWMAGSYDIEAYRVQRDYIEDLITTQYPKENNE